MNEVIKTISSLFVFLYKKILNAQKCKSSRNQLTKQKQTSKKQRQPFFMHKNLEGENHLFCVSLRCLDSLIYYTALIKNETEIHQIF